MCSWNLRGKPLDAIQIGGQGEAARPWDRLSLKLGAHVLGFRGQSRGLFLFPGSLHCGRPDSLCGESRIDASGADGCCQEAGGAHVFGLFTLPYEQREDCLQVWERTSEELDLHLSALRYHDVVCVGADLNMEVFAQNSHDERRVHLQDVLLNHALSISHPREPTWVHSRGLSSALEHGHTSVVNGRLMVLLFCKHVI